ncbi:MAG: hypothetical protein ABW196_09480 [Solirubrobacterales bacterium]
MRGSRSPLGLLALISAFAVLAFGVSSAQAAFGIAKFEALTCATDASAPGVGSWEDNGAPCLKSGPTADPFTQAAGHPNWGITAFLMNQVTGPPPLPDGFIKQIRTELPEGLGVNPEATPQCTRKQLSEPAALPPPLITKCATEVPGSQVGINYLTTISAGPPNFPVPAGTEFTVPIPVYNLEPEFGEPSSAGFNATGKPVILESDLDPVDQHISFTIHDIEAPPASLPVIGSRLVFNGQAGEGYLTMPSNCAGPQVTQLEVRSDAASTGGVELADEAPGETAVGADGCENVPFDPSIDVTASGATDSPEPSTVDVQLPYNPNPLQTQTSPLLKAVVTLPEGAGLNPSVANGLEPCTNAQFAQGTNDPIACPASSKIGTVEVETPALPEILGGDVYVGEPTSNDPTTGNQFRIFIHVNSPKFGVNVRLVGNVFPNLQTGRLTAVVDNNPQAPFSSFKVHIEGGPRGALTSPDTCGPHTTTAQMTPWSNNPPVKDTEPSSFNLTTAPGGGPCPKTLAERPFSPTFLAGPKATKAGAFSPFELRITRPDGAQEIRQVKVNLPPGMVAKLKGVEYCPEASIAAAGSRSGKDELASPSCPASSLVGTTGIDAGSGPAPFRTNGQVYLAGPYKGAPVSFVFVTPAVAGPYDLGTVVVRAALNIDPETAEVHAVSDAIPYVFGGVKLDIRAIDVSINRQSFTLNPTTCREPFSIGAGILGGGGNPADPASWFETKPSNAFRASDCKALKYQPSFYARIFGGKNQVQRAAHPKFRATLDARNGDANTRRAAFILPRATILDQGHIKTICTRVQLAANDCPKASIYGNAKATSPLLDGKLKGPVYLTSSNNTLPDLLADLKGQVNVRLRGVISSSNGRLKTVFRKTPDVAVDKFVLTMKGGDKGLLVNSRNLCSRQTTGFLNLKAQNSRQLKRKNLRLNIPACRGGKNN